jgi:hypothetical protein
MHAGKRALQTQCLSKKGVLHLRHGLFKLAGRSRCRCDTLRARGLWFVTRNKITGPSPTHLFGGSLLQGGAHKLNRESGRHNHIDLTIEMANPHSPIYFQFDLAI